MEIVDLISSEFNDKGRNSKVNRSLSPTSSDGQSVLRPDGSNSQPMRLLQKGHDMLSRCVSPHRFPAKQRINEFYSQRRRERLLLRLRATSARYERTSITPLVWKRRIDGIEFSLLVVRIRPLRLRLRRPLYRNLR